MLLTAGMMFQAFVINYSEVEHDDSKETPGAAGGRLYRIFGKHLCAGQE